MAYSDSKKLTDTEKRLEALKTQLFGKQGIQIKTSINSQANIPTTNFTPSYQAEDLTYLKKDLRKIAFLASIALGAQIFLYLQFSFKLLKLN